MSVTRKNTELDFFRIFDNENWKPIKKFSSEKRGFSVLSEDKVYFNVRYIRKTKTQSQLIIMIGRNVMEKLAWRENDKILTCFNPEFETHLRLEKVDKDATGTKLLDTTHAKAQHKSTHCKLQISIKKSTFTYNPVFTREVEFYIQAKTGRLLLVLDDSPKEKKDV